MTVPASQTHPASDISTTIQAKSSHAQPSQVPTGDEFCPHCDDKKPTQAQDGIARCIECGVCRD